MRSILTSFWLHLVVQYPFFNSDKVGLFVNAVYIHKKKNCKMDIALVI